MMKQKLGVRLLRLPLMLLVLSAPALPGCRDETTPRSPCAAEGPYAADVFAVQGALIERWCPPDRLFVTTSEEQDQRDSMCSKKGDQPDRPVPFVLGVVPPHIDSELHKLGPSSWRAVSCRPRTEFDPEDPAQSPGSVKITTYLLEFSSSPVQVVQAQIEMLNATRDWGLAFVGDHFLELLDVADRRTVAEEVLRDLQVDGVLDTANQQALEARVGPLGNAPDSGGDRGYRVFVIASRGGEGTPAKDQVISVSAIVNMRLPKPCRE